MVARIIVFLLLASQMAFAAPYWVPGVSAEGGWHDADKSLENDGDLCWASTAANMVAWWQDRHPQETAASGSPRGLEAVWAAFRAAPEGRCCSRIRKNSGIITKSFRFYITWW